jgi:hypothetical protein
VGAVFNRDAFGFRFQKKYRGCKPLPPKPDARAATPRTEAWAAPQAIQQT